MNFVLRGVCANPGVARLWLETEMFPEIVKKIRAPSFIETSHLFCKGFIEPTIELGLRPNFLILCRPAADVAASLLAINCVPDRTPDGKLVLVAPGDPGVQKTPDWKSFTDYQMCYWYAKEIERKQKNYEEILPAFGCNTMRINMSELFDVKIIHKVAEFVTGTEAPKIDIDRVFSTLEKNQNPREWLVASPRDIPPEEERQKQQTEVDKMFSHVTKI